MRMKITTLVLLQLTVVLGSGSHTLVFLSTGKWSSLPRFFFEQLTVFDNVTVSTCDGATRREHFKPQLQKAVLPDRCDEAHNNILESIYNILDHSNNTVDIVQRRRGCSSTPDGVVFTFESWALNGNEFLIFDPEALTWTSKSHFSQRIKELWDKQLTRNHAFRAFLKNFCPKMIQQITLKSVPINTVLTIFAKPIENSKEAQLLCHVTTTDPSVKSVHLIGDGVTRISGFSVMGPLPSGDNSWVLRLRTRISLSLTHLTYGCAVASEYHNTTVYWKGTTLDGSYIDSISNRVLIVFLGFLAVIVVILVISCAMITLLKIIKMRRRPPPPPQRPELRAQFESFIQSASLYPDIRNILLSYLYGPNTPDPHQDNYDQWLEMVELENNYDPEFYGGRVK